MTRVVGGVDADFVGDRPDFKYASGIYLALVGPNSLFHLAAKAQKQTAVAHATLEAEVISVSLAVRTIRLPSLDIWVICSSDRYSWLP